MCCPELLSCAVKYWPACLHVVPPHRLCWPPNLQLLKAQLGVGRKVHLEYSNEVWNGAWIV